VCAITITRLAIASRLTTNDFTYDLAKLAIFTDLEPLLGIIVACAPLFPPTFKAVHDRMLKRSSSGSSARGFARLTNKGTTGIQNQASDASYPFVDIEGGRNKTLVTSPSSQPNSLLGINADASDEDARLQHTITVTTGWDIRTDSSKLHMSIYQPADHYTYDTKARQHTAELLLPDTHHDFRGCGHLANSSDGIQEVSIRLDQVAPFQATTSFRFKGTPVGEHWIECHNPDDDV
ncbi:MAG: hypothetical protein Q9184_007546, partial [Pyrenodesmia sp. 2 TL-2023]